MKIETGAGFGGLVLGGVLGIILWQEIIADMEPPATWDAKMFRDVAGISLMNVCGLVGYSLFHRAARFAFGKG